MWSVSYLLLTLTCKHCELLGQGAHPVFPLKFKVIKIMVKFQIKVLLYKVCNTMPNNIPVNVTSYFFEWGGGGVSLTL